MNKVITLILMTCVFSGFARGPLSFMDSNLESALLNYSPTIDVNQDGYLTDYEVSVVTSLDLSGKNITDLSGIEAFVNLETLYCFDNQISFLDLSSGFLNINDELEYMINLKILNCSNNGMSSLNISRNVALTDLDASLNPSLTICVPSINQASINSNFKKDVIAKWSEECTKVNIPNENFKSALIALGINKKGTDYFTFIDLEKITSLDVSNKNISDLRGIEYFVNLKIFNASNNNFKSLKLPNRLSILNISNNTDLIIFKHRYGKLTSLDISGNTALTSLDVFGNQLTSLDISGNTALTSLDCRRNSQTLKICINSNHDTSNWEKDATATYSTTCEVITTLNESTNNNLVVIKAYNLQGVEVPIDTKDELIILLYNNGKTEKVIQY